jgi:hypothetical protein
MFAAPDLYEETLELYISLMYGNPKTPKILPYQVAKE